MSNEITVGASLALKNDNLRDSTAVQGVKLDQAEKSRAANTQTLSTTAAPLDMGSVINPGYLLAKNLDLTVNCLVGVVVSSVGTFVAVADIPPGGQTLIPMASPPWAKSSAGTPQLDYTLYGR